MLTKSEQFTSRELTIFFQLKGQVSMECRSPSLTSHGSDQQPKGSVELDLSVLKSEEQPSSPSLHVPCQSPSASHCLLPSTEILHSDGARERTPSLSLDEPKNPNIRRTLAQPTICWIPLTNEQVSSLAGVLSVSFTLPVRWNRWSRKNVGG